MNNMDLRDASASKKHPVAMMIYDVTISEKNSFSFMKNNNNGRDVQEHLPAGKWNDQNDPIFSDGLLLQIAQHRLLKIT